MESVKSSGPPLGAATQSTGRPYLENGLPRPAPPNGYRRPPTSQGTNGDSNGGSYTNTNSGDKPNYDLSAAPPGVSVNRYHAQKQSGSLPEPQIVALAKEALQEALEKQGLNAANGTDGPIPPGVTVELSYMKITRLPEEMVDIVKNNVERLALSHNFLSTIPTRFNECHSLRYVNLRYNQFREVPLSLCQLTTLEILDLGRNKITTLPPEIQQLTSLKVLSLEKNRIERLPVFLGDMKNLSAIRVTGNPMREPPASLCEPELEEGREHDHMQITANIKQWLREKTARDRSETESGEDEFSEGHETPRPMKRVMSGRFPIRVNGSDVPDIRSPALPRPPPIPSRSHYRGLSAQNAALRRPSVAPLAINSSSANERLRSNSENILLAQRSSTASDRSRRMGIVPKKSELGTVDETTSNRYSHNRGLSHGSAILGNSNGTSRSTRSPRSPANSDARSTYVRRLSSLPERKRISTLPDAATESAKGIAYCLYQIQPHIEILIGLTQHENEKRASLEAVFYNANVHFDDLERQLMAYESYVEEDEEVASLSSENVHRACLTATTAYVHVCTLLQNSIHSLFENGDPRFIRTLLITLWAGLGELHCASYALFANLSESNQMPADSITISTITRSATENISDGGRNTPQPQGKVMAPPNRRPRKRSNTAATGYIRVDDLNVDPGLLSARLETVSSATPRSGDSFMSVIDSSMVGDGFTEEDAQFERIYLQLQETLDLSLGNLPSVRGYLQGGMLTCASQVTPRVSSSTWEHMIQLTNVASTAAHDLRNRLSSIQLRDPSIRTQEAFWQLCYKFTGAYIGLAGEVKAAKLKVDINMNEIVHLLRPMQKGVQACVALIKVSPWRDLFTSHINNAQSISFSTKSEAYPMTPQSATLGPAIQATVPSTPQSASTFNAVFDGGFFQRADTYLASNSAASSRTGTMTSTDGMASIISPATSTNSNYAMNPRFNFNGNGGKMN